MFTLYQPKGDVMDTTKIVVLFFVLLIFLSVYDYYLKPAYYNFTDGEGHNLGETLLGYTMVVGFAFLVSFVIIRKMKATEKNSSSDGDGYQ